MGKPPNHETERLYDSSKTLEEVWENVKSKGVVCINDRGCWTVKGQDKSMSVRRGEESLCLKVTSYALRRGLEYNQVATTIPKSDGTHTEMVVTNWCGTPKCLNPLHLIHKSTSKKARIRKTHTTSKVLSDETKRKIKEKYASGATQRQLAEEFGVSQPSISYVVNRWRDPSLHG